MNILNFVKKDFHSIPLGVKLVVLVIFLRSLGFGLIDPFFSIYLSSFNINYSLIGILSAVLPLASLLTTIPLMRLADRVKEAVIIHDGELLYLLIIFVFIAAGLTKNIILLVIGLIGFGVSHTLIYTGTEAYIRKHNKYGKAGPFGYYTTLDYLGWIIGMIITAFAIKYYSLNYMFLFILPAVLLSLFILPRIRERGIKSLIHGLTKYFHTSKDFFNIFQDWQDINPKMTFFLIISFFDGLMRSFAVIFIPLFGLSINLSLQHIALLMALMYSPYIFSYFFAEVEDRLKKMKVIAVSLFIGAISFLLLFFMVNKLWIAVMVSAISFSIALIRPAYNGAITRLTPRTMLGEITGVNNFVERLGRIVGPVLTGVIADVWGLKFTFLFIAVIGFILGIFSLTFRGYDNFVNA